MMRGYVDISSQLQKLRFLSGQSGPATSPRHPQGVFQGVALTSAASGALCAFLLEGTVTAEMAVLRCKAGNSACSASGLKA